MNTSASSSIS
ncbi:hypothetical protein VCHC41A1_1969, partial [Vibrio cholerae HC-41A1]